MVVDTALVMLDCPNLKLLDLHGKRHWHSRIITCSSGRRSLNLIRAALTLDPFYDVNPAPRRCDAVSQS